MVDIYSLPIVIAVIMSLREIFTPGVSKYAVRLSTNEALRAGARAAGLPESAIAKIPWLPSPFIHSYQTYFKYLSICVRYAVWLYDNHPDVRRIQYAHKMRYDFEYIELQISRGLSAYTIATTRSALAKLHRCRGYEVHPNIPARHYAAVTKCRSYSEVRFSHDLSKYGYLASLCRCTGVRKNELKHITEDCFREADDGNLYLHLDGKKQHTKGGRTRDVEIMPQNQETVREIIRRFKPGELICPAVPSGLKVHAIRRLYASDFYAAIARPITGELRAKRVPLKHPRKDYRHPDRYYTDAPGTYRRRSDGRVFDRRALLIVSRSLGHNRADVVVQNYLN